MNTKINTNKIFRSHNDACSYCINDLCQKVIDNKMRYTYCYKIADDNIEYHILADVKRNKWNINVGIIYIISDGVEYKIGRAKYGSKRFAEYTKWREKKDIIFALVYDYEEFEKKLHWKYKDNNNHNEWFRFSDSELEEVINYIKCHSYEISQTNIFRPDYNQEKVFDISSNVIPSYNTKYIYEISLDKDGCYNIKEGYAEYKEYRIRTTRLGNVPIYCPVCGGDDFYVRPSPEKERPNADYGSLRCKCCDNFIKKASYEDIKNVSNLEYKKDDYGNYIKYKYYPSLKFSDENINKVIPKLGFSLRFTIYCYDIKDGIDSIMQYFHEKIEYSSKQIDEYCRRIENHKNDIVKYNDCGNIFSHYIQDYLFKKLPANESCDTSIR